MIAVIGKREVNDYERWVIESIAMYLVSNGFDVVTGGAYGVDAVAMQGASAVDPTKVYVVHPWMGFNKELLYMGNNVVTYNPSTHDKWTNSVHKYHPNPNSLSKGAVALHARNYGIVYQAKQVIAWPRNKRGGTYQGLRIAMDLNIPIVNLYTNQDTILKKLESAGYIWHGSSDLSVRPEIIKSTPEISTVPWKELQGHSTKHAKVLQLDFKVDDSEYVVLDKMVVQFMGENLNIVDLPFEELSLSEWRSEVSSFFINSDLYLVDLFDKLNLKGEI